ncbi:tetratricopeptide repeat domain-containing protein [Coniella lustricola]|uniref:Tetratricopeptide repeat domain-containing protein n=1 Tax=Coniella lustricola TaxID=2025994 RepID=A0A2T2ZS67_9PEZI|nr:tetratricopeptide repeat domain-containing protein [Coniella lustricola]
MATDQDTFTLLPLSMHPQTKAITTTSSSSSSSTTTASRALAAELEALNTLHRTLLSTLEAPFTVPPPPVPVLPKRSAQIKKLRETGNDAFKAAKYQDAIGFYTLGLKMALTRPHWEPSGLVRDEAAMLFANRAQAHMELRDWVQGSADAECSVEAKKVGNPKAWFRRGKCLFEMGRYEEARDWVGKGLEVEGEDSEMLKLQKEVEAKLP